MLRNFWRQFARSWRSHSAVQLATLSVLTGVFTVVVISWLVHKNLDAVLTRWGQNVELSVYLKDSINNEQVSKLRSMIDDLESFEKVDYLSKEQAAQLFKSQMGNYSPDFLNDEEFGNPLPASFELQLLPDLATTTEGSDVLGTLVKKISTWPGVDEVSYGQEWINNYASVVKSFSVSSWFLMVILFSGSLLIVGNSVRNSINQRRDEIEIMELVGATTSTIRTPYLFEGAFMGGVASALALLLSYSIYYWQRGLLVEGASIWGLDSLIQFLNVGEVLMIICMGMGFGTLGAFFCVRRICSGWSAAQRVESWSEV